jgi:hypothetical protein
LAAALKVELYDYFCFEECGVFSRKEEGGFLRGRRKEPFGGRRKDEGGRRILLRYRHFIQDRTTGA